MPRNLITLPRQQLRSLSEQWASSRGRAPVDQSPRSFEAHRQSSAARRTAVIRVMTAECRTNAALIPAHH